MYNSSPNLLYTSPPDNGQRVRSSSFHRVRAPSFHQVAPPPLQVLNNSTVLSPTTPTSPMVRNSGTRQRSGSNFGFMNAEQKTLERESDAFDFVGSLMKTNSQS